MESLIKKILVTGSSGTIGTRLCEKLLPANYELVGVDWKPNKWSKEVEAFTVHRDLRDKSAVNSLAQDFDLIVHLAANARVYNLVEEPSLARDNFETTFNTLDFARKNNIKRFIFASSREVYGNSQTIVHSEDEAYVKNCESPYTASKIGGEALVHAYQQCYDIDFVILRFSNVYGMYDDSDRVVPVFVRLTRQGRDLTVFGEEKVLDFTYIDDCVNGIVKVIDNFEDIKNATYNLSSGEGTSIKELALLVQGLMCSRGQVIVKQSRTGEVIKFVGDITRAKEKFAYLPKTDITEGIKKSIGWYQKNVL